MVSLTTSARHSGVAVWQEEGTWYVFSMWHQIDCKVSVVSNGSDLLLLFFPAVAAVPCLPNDQLLCQVNFLFGWCSLGDQLGHCHMSLLLFCAGRLTTDVTT